MDIKIKHRKLICLYINSTDIKNEISLLHIRFIFIPQLMFSR